MKKEWLLLFLSVTVTILVALYATRLFAPHLLGIPPELQLVKVAQELPPFFEVVFRREDYETDDFMLKDPYVNRGKPLYPDMGDEGPHDILGFRNRSIPNVADIITIGDSQTYGNNATLEENWPSQLVANLQHKSATLYDMSVGAWGAAQYYEIFEKAIFFQPRVVIVAFYTGNDPLDSFVRVYGDEDRYHALRPDPKLRASDVPEVSFPPLESDRWRVEFSDGVTTTFTPKYRHASNQDHPAVRAGYGIMAKAARAMSVLAQQYNVHIIFTIIPTKELVYAEKVRDSEITPPPEYVALIRDEEDNIRELSRQLGEIPNAIYVDVCGPLQEAALQAIALYPPNINGHPISTGYAVIAKALAGPTGDLLPDKPEGLVAIKHEKEQYWLYLVRGNRLWWFRSPGLVFRNGWSKTDVQVIGRRDIANIPRGGIIDSVDPGRFGPLGHSAR